MEVSFVVEVLRAAILNVLFTAAPMLGASLIVGLIISIFQTTTAIQEQTLVFAPKILAVLLTFLLLSPWIISRMVYFTQQLYLLIPKMGG